MYSGKKIWADSEAVVRTSVGETVGLDVGTSVGVGIGL